jgi:hypothetical protein
VQLKTYPDLNLACLKRRKDRELRVWYVMRHIDAPSGSGVVDLDKLEAFGKEHDLFSRATLYRVLESGRGLFWHKRRGGRWQYVGLHTLADALTGRLSAQPVTIPLEDFRTLQRFRGALVASLFVRKERTITQGRLAELCGRTSRTVRNYLVAAGVRITPNAMLSTRKPPECGQPLDADLAQQGFYRIKIKGEIVLCRRMANTYWQPRGDTRAYGLVRHYTRPTDVSSHGQGAYRRVYFDDAQAASKRVGKLEEGERLYFLTGARDHLGCRLWVGQERVNGGISTC